MGQQLGTAHAGEHLQVGHFLGTGQIAHEHGSPAEEGQKDQQGQGRHGCELPEDAVVHCRTGRLPCGLLFLGGTAFFTRSHIDIFLLVCLVCLTGLGGLFRAEGRCGSGFGLVRSGSGSLCACLGSCRSSGLAGEACGPGSLFKLLQPPGGVQELFLGLAQLGLQILGTGRQGRGLWLFGGRCPGDRGVFLGSRRPGGKGCPGIRIPGSLCLFLAVTDRRCSLVHREILNHVAAGKRSPRGNGQLAGL